MSILARPAIHYCLGSIGAGTVPLYVVAGHVLSRIITQLHGIAVTHFETLVKKLRRPAISRDIPRVLAIMSGGPCRDALKTIFEENGWKLAFADTSRAALHRQGRTPFFLVLYQRSAARRHWTAEVSRLSTMSPRPSIVLLSETTDKNLWDEVGRSGGSDILRIPFDRNAVIHVVQSEWILWCNQQNVRLGRARF